jgi:hypothetical protein
MSKAVPWSGLVRTSGSPSVTFTPFSTPRYFTGIRPWSWYIATTTSNSPLAAWARAHEHGVGRERAAGVDALGARGLDGRRDDLELLAAEQPPSPACGFRPATAMRGARPSAVQRRVGDAQGLQHPLEASRPRWHRAATCGC